jgi:hypothetical protein
MSEQACASTESIMADALAAKGVAVTPDTPTSSGLMGAPAPAEAEGTVRSGAYSSSLTEDIMASALADAGKLPTPEGVTEATPSPIEVNPGRTAQEAETFAIGAGIEPGLAKFYSGRIEKALREPALAPEAQRQSTADTHAAMVREFGDDAEGYGHVARREFALLARDHPNLPAILERTNLGNDMHLIKSLIARAADRELKARGYKK